CGLQHTRHKAFAHQVALAVAAVGVEAVADDRFAVADDVGDDGHKAQCHLREIDVGVADVRLDRAGGFEDVDDFHDHDNALQAPVPSNTAIAYNYPIHGPRQPTA